MSFPKHLKNSLAFDLIYRSSSKNAFALPFVKKSSVFAVDISSLPKMLSNANAIKVLSSSIAPKTSVASAPINELSIKKGDPINCRLVLGKKQTSYFMSSCSLAFSSMSSPKPFLLNLKSAVVFFSFSDLRNFFPYAYYESSLSTVERANLSCSVYFSGPLYLGPICLLSVYFPYFGFKKKINDARTILREMEQSG